MTNVYIDPSSHVYLDNVLFREDTEYNRDNTLGGWYYLKKYCAERGITLHTIDLRNSAVVRAGDIYVSCDHKFLPRKLYWKFRNRKYPIINPNKFAKSILFQFEPPVVMPEIRYLKNHVLKAYDKIFFTWKTNDPKIHYFHTAQGHDGIFPDYWQRTDRKFLTLINSNRKALSRYKELLTERVRAILFFEKTNDIDLYGFGWGKPPLFPYWFHKNAIRKVYKGSVADKYRTLSEYTYALAFENSELPGYMTDKLFDCLYAGTIPVYRGAPDVKEYIPENCFIDMRDFKNYEELRTYLKSLPGSEIKAYRENGRCFLESDQYKPFTKEHFAKVFIEACIGDTT